MAESKTLSAAAATDDDKVDEAAKRKLFERRWSRDDEIRLLNAVIDFQARHGHKPIGHSHFEQLLATQHDWHCTFTSEQLRCKVRHTRNKYLKNPDRDVGRMSSPQKKVHELSKKLWGDSVDVDQLLKKKKKKKKKKTMTTMTTTTATTVADDDDLDANVRYLMEILEADGVGSYKLQLLEKHLLRNVEPKSVAAYASRWREVQLEELRAWTKHVELTLDLR